MMMEPSDTLQIEPMTRDDVPRVHALETQCFSMPWDIESYYGETVNPSALYRVARLNDAIVGFGGMWVVDGEAHIVTLAVDPAYRRHGIGRQLLEKLLEAARDRQVHQVTLEVRVSNTPAKALYQAFGFRTIAFRKRYYPDNGEDAAVMKLELAEAGD